MSVIEESQKSSEVRSDLKLIVIGTSGTGKTSFIHKWVDGDFTETVKATIVSQFKFKIIENGGRRYRVQIWDIAGQDKNIIVTKIFSKGTHGVIVMSDAKNKDSLPE